MGLKQMQAVVDDEEIAYQMAFDLIEADEKAAGVAGVPNVSQVRASDGIRFDDPDMLAKLERYWPVD